MSGNAKNDQKAGDKKKSWTAENMNHLLFALVAKDNPGLNIRNWKAIEKEMLSHGFTLNACQIHWNQVRKKREASATKADGTSITQGAKRKAATDEGSIDDGAPKAKKTKKAVVATARRA